MNRSSPVIIYEDESRKWHCRFCIGIWGLNDPYRICEHHGLYHREDRSCYSSDSGTQLKEKKFGFDNKRHKIILSVNRNNLTSDNISHLQIKCTEKIALLENG